MEKNISLKQLVEMGELSEDSSNKMDKSWITNTNELYILINSALINGTDEMRSRIAQDLDIPTNKLKGYMEYIKPYVSHSVINPEEIKKHSTGCLITKEQIGRINMINSLSPEEFENWRMEETERFYRKHSEYRK